VDKEELWGKMRRDRIIMNIKTKESNELKNKKSKEWPKVAIIILNWNGWKDTIECLESVVRNTYSNYQVIVIDNGSTNASMEKIKEWAEGKQEVLTPEPTHPLYHLSHPPVKKPIPYIYYTREEAERGGDIALEEKATKEWQERRKTNSKELNPTPLYPLVLIQTGENLGFAGGNNVGVRYTIKKDEYDYILLLNNDTVINPNFLNELVEYYDDSTGICAPIIFKYNNTNKIWSSGGKYNIFLGTYTNIATLIKEKQRETNFISGCCWLIKQEIFKKIGLLDNTYFLYSEDVDFCYRLKQLGYKLKIIPSSSIFHKISKTTGVDSTLMFYYFHRSKLMFIYKNYSGIKKFFYLNLNIAIRYLRIFEYFIKGKKPLSKSIIKALREYKDV